jgi:hypothetical protein
MRLAEFAVLVDAPPKWVLNARALLGEAGSYALAAAERFALIRELNRDFSMELRQARAIADEALASPHNPGESAGVVRLHIDIPRLRSAIAARASQLGTLHVRRRAGRKPKRIAPIAAAKRYGIDVTLLQANLMRTHAERLRQLDGMVAFTAALRRAVQERR